MTKTKVPNDPYWMPPVSSKSELTMPPEDYPYAFAAHEPTDVFTGRSDVWVYKDESWSDVPVSYKEAYAALGYFEVDA